MFDGYGGLLRCPFLMVDGYFFDRLTVNPIKGATSQYFESFSAMCKIMFNLKEITKY